MTTIICIKVKKVTKEQAATIQQLNDKIRHLEDKGNTTNDQCDDNKTHARQKVTRYHTNILKRVNLITWLINYLPADIFLTLYIE